MPDHLSTAPRSNAVPSGSTPALDGRGVRVLRDQPYGMGTIGYDSADAATRPLLMDAFLPDGEPPADGWPVLVLSHGGAFHRGAKDRDEFEQDGSRNTPVHEYCERFATRGYACFSIGYRLTQERPSPQVPPIRRNREAIERERIDWVRERLGLGAASNVEILNGAEAAYADVANAFRHIHAHADHWRIDRHRMAIGGFSAGGFASLYAVFALGIPAAAVVVLSGGMDPEDAEYYVHGARGLPPVLMFSGEHDLPSVPRRTGSFLHAAGRAGLDVQHYQVTGKPHFYEGASPTVLLQATQPDCPKASTVEDAMRRFLDRALTPAEVDVDALEAFAQAWSRHDIDALMSFMTDDCVFQAWTGPQASGAAHIGREAVRAAYQRAWADFPDAQWTRARHFVCGHRGVSEWTFVGTRASDGARVEVDGCDLFSFRGGLIRVKDSWRKLRVMAA